MEHTHKLLARTYTDTEIGTFRLEQGEDLDVRVVEEIKKAGENGSLARMAIRVGYPTIKVSEAGEGEGLSGGENVTSVRLYAADGSPVADRRVLIEPVQGGFALIAIEDSVEKETPIGVFADKSVADQVGLIWCNGHLSLPL